MIEQRTVEQAEAGEAGALRERGRSPSAEALRGLRRNRGAVIGLSILVLLALAALLAPLIAPYDPTATAPRDRTQPPSTRHLFGTDNLGRDRPGEDCSSGCRHQ